MKTPEELAKEREARIASRNQRQQPPPAASAATNNTQSTAPAQELTANVVDPARLDKAALYTMSGPFNAGTDNPHWLLCAEGEPLAKIALADQEQPASIRTHFCTAEYANGVINATKKFPILNVMASVKARHYIAAVRSSEVFAQLDKGYKAKAEEAFREKAANYSDTFATMMNLVAEAQQKNYITENPLKDALFAEFKRAGVADPTQSIERAFGKGFTPWVEQTMQTALKWANFSPEALADIQQTITSMGTRPVQASKQASPRNPQDHVPTAAANVPLTTQASTSRDESTTSEKEVARSTYSFRNRMLGRQVPPNG